MMTIECAIIRSVKMLARLHHIVERNEREWKCMDRLHRDEMGTIRCLMFHSGVPKEQLGEMPFLDTDHLKEFIDRQARRKAAKESAEVAP